VLADHPIFVVFLVAVLAPLIAQTRLGSRMPVVVFEVVLGIIIGPQVLQLVADHGFLAFMREVGMVAVMFMAGMEIDFARIRGRPLALGATGWLASIAVSAAALAVLHPLLGLALPPTLVIALATTGMGTLLPILRDGGLLARRRSAPCCWPPAPSARLARSSPPRWCSRAGSAAGRSSRC
jgi:Kef-type K+ transport system membrane component KefB